MLIFQTSKFKLWREIYRFWREIYRFWRKAYLYHSYIRI